MAANPSKCGIPEETIVDCALGRLGDRREQEVWRHIAGCADCAAMYEDWRRLFDAPTPAPAPTPTAAPPATLRKRLAHAVRRQRTAAFLRRLQPRRQSHALAAVAMCMLALALFLSSPASAPGEPAPQDGTIPHMDIALKPETVKFAFKPGQAADAGGVTGYVWMNRHSQEVLVVMEGLAPLRDRDYQAWIVTGDEYASAGVLRSGSGTSHVYYRGERLGDLRGLAISLEPKGGSRLPTDAGHMWVVLKQRHVAGGGVELE